MNGRRNRSAYVWGAALAVLCAGSLAAQTNSGPRPEEFNPFESAEVAPSGMVASETTHPRPASSGSARYVLIPDLSDAPMDHGRHEALHEIRDALARRDADGAMRLLDEMSEADCEELRLLTLRLRARASERRGDRLNATAAWRMWLLTLDAEGTGDPAEEKIQKAREEFALALGPRSAALNRRKAQEYLRSGDYEMAARHLNEAAKSYPDYDWSRDYREVAMVCAAQAVARGDGASAKRELEEWRDRLDTSFATRLESEVAAKTAAEHARRGELNNALLLLEILRKDDTARFGPLCQKALEASLVEAVGDGDFAYAEKLTEKAKQLNVSISPLLVLAVELPKASDSRGNLESALAAARPGDTRLPRSSQKVRQLYDRWQSLSSTISGAQRTLDQAKKEKADAEKVIAAGEKDIASIDQELPGIAEKAAETSAEVAALDAQISGLQTQREEAQKKYQRLKNQENAQAALKTFGSIAGGMGGAMGQFQDLSDLAQDMQDISTALKTASSAAQLIQGANTSAQVQSLMTQMDVQIQQLKTDRNRLGSPEQLQQQADQLQTRRAQWVTSMEQARVTIQQSSSKIAAAETALEEANRERSQEVAGEFSGFGQNSFRQFRIDCLAIGVGINDMIEQKAHILNRRVVHRHDLSCS